MALTDAQLQALKTDIQGNSDPTVVQALADGANNLIADWYNQEASPAYWIYRKYVASEEIRDAIDAKDLVDITDTDRGRAVDLLSIRAERGFSGENARDRLAWDDVFSTAAGDNSQQAILVLWTRLASNVEKVFATSTGTGVDAANADVTNFQGTITFRDVIDALNS